MYKSRIPRPLAIGLSISLLFAGETAQAVTFKKLIHLFQDRPDHTQSQIPQFLGLGCPAISGADVVFRATNTESRPSFDSIWLIKTNGAGLRKLVSTQNAVPGGIGLFTSFGNGWDQTLSPVIAKGRVVFYGFDANPDNTLRAVGGLYSAHITDGSLRRVANYKTVNPTNHATAFGQFTGISTQPCHNSYVFDGYRVFFTAASLGGADPSGVYQARYDGVGLKSVRDNTMPDDSFAPWSLRGFYGPNLGLDPNNGTILFGHSGYNVFGPQALYLDGHKVLTQPMTLPSDPNPNNGVLRFNYLALDGSKAVFTASHGNYFGLFSRARINTSIRRLFSNLNKLPGMAQCPIDNIDSFAADSGNIVFFAHTTNCDGKTANGRSGIFLIQGSKVSRIVATDDMLPDGSKVVYPFNELGQGSLQGNRLVFSMRTTLYLQAIYVATW
jgi:hypothetical protein